MRRGYGVQEVSTIAVFCENLLQAARIASWRKMPLRSAWSLLRCIMRTRPSRCRILCDAPARAKGLDIPVTVQSRADANADPDANKRPEGKDCADHRRGAADRSGDSAGAGGGRRRYRHHLQHLR